MPSLRADMASPNAGVTEGKGLTVFKLVGQKKDLSIELRCTGSLESL